MRRRIWRPVTGKQTAGPVRHVSIVCIALLAGGHVAFVSHARGRWGRASPGDKFFRTVGDTDSRFPVPASPTVFDSAYLVIIATAAAAFAFTVACLVIIVVVIMLDVLAALLRRIKLCP